MSGKEARYILKQNSINLAWLAEQIGISPQALNSRLNADVFSRTNMIEINQIMKKDIFGIGEKPAEVLSAGTIPIYDMRASMGFGSGLYDDMNTPVEHVSIPGLSGCVGLTVYGDSMLPRYRSGDVVFVRPIQDIIEIDWGHPYIIISRSDRFMKLLYPSDATDCIRLVSANEETRTDGSRLYPDKDMPTAEILHLYKVVGQLRREQL
jgi:hypothetical protein